MTGVQVVALRYFRAFAKDKGKILLCTMLSLCAGVIVPFLYKSSSMQMITIIGISIFYLTQTISGVFAQEKEKRTLETLLSTPISTHSMFVGKMLLSVIVSGLVLLFSSASILVAANGINRYAMVGYSLVGFSLSEWLLLLGGGFMVAVLMIFISGYSALMSKTPRAGLWVSLFASLAIVVPHWIILFYVNNQLPVSAGYTVLLLVINAFCFTLALGKVDRRALLSRI